MNTPLIKSLLATAALALLAPNVTLAQTTGVRGSHILPELLPDGERCSRHSTQELMGEFPSLRADFGSFIRTLEGLHWLLAEKLETEINSLTFCTTNRTLRRVRPEALSDVTIYLQNGIQVAVRHGLEVYLDMNVFRRMSARTQTLVLTNQVLHGFVGLDVSSRDIKIQNLMSALSSVMSGTITRAELALQIVGNGVDNRIIPAQVAELPRDIAHLHRTLRTWDNTRSEEERLVTTLQLHNRVAAQPQEQRIELMRLMLHNQNAATAARQPLLDYASSAGNDTEFARRLSLLGTLTSEEIQSAFIFAVQKNRLSTAQTMFDDLTPQARQRTITQVFSDWAELPLIEAWYDATHRQQLLDAFPRQDQIEFIVTRINANNHARYTSGEPNSLHHTQNGNAEVQGNLVYKLILRAINYNKPEVAQYLQRHFNVDINFADNELLTLAVSGNANSSLRFLFRENPQLQSQRRDLQLATYMGNSDTFNMIWHNSPQDARSARVRYSYFSGLTQAATLTNIAWDDYMDLLEIAILGGNTNAVRVIANDPAGPLGRSDRRDHVQLAVNYSRITGSAPARTAAEAIAEIVTAAVQARLRAP